MTDKNTDLIRGLREQSPKAQRMALERYGSYVFAQVARLVPGVENAEELYQDVFVKVFKNIKMSGNNGIFFDYPIRYTRPYDEGYMDMSNIVFDGFEGSSYGSSVQIVAEPGIKIRGVRDVTFRNFNVECARPLRFVGNHDSILTNIRLENFTAEVNAKTPLEAVATEPLTFRNCTLNGAKCRTATSSRRAGNGSRSSAPGAGRGRR